MNNEYIWIMEEDMLKALQDGKRLYMTVNDEYAVVLKLGDEENERFY